jgi:hypothetical protein
MVAGSASSPAIILAGSPGSRCTKANASTETTNSTGIMAIHLFIKYFNMYQPW